VTRLVELKPLLRIPLNENAYLRPVLSSDVTDTYVNGLNDPSVNRFLGQSRERRQSYETVRSYVEENYRNPDGVLFGLFLDGELRGTVRLHEVHNDKKDAIVGVLIFDKNYWQKGWASRAIAAVVAFATRELGLTIFKAGMVAQNTASRNTFARLGFRHLPEFDWVDPQGNALESWQLDVIG
jgi:[ribosomal protein S5]-alanine N-acetyltransferase